MQRMLRGTDVDDSRSGFRDRRHEPVALVVTAEEAALLSIDSDQQQEVPVCIIAIDHCCRCPTGEAQLEVFAAAIAADVDGDRSRAPRGWDAHSRGNESEVAVEDVVHRLHAVYLLQ